MTGPIVLHQGEGAVLDVFGTTLTIKAAATDTDGAYSLIECAVEPGGFGPIPHRHLDREESFVVLEGEVDFRVDEETVRGTAGSFLLVTRGVVHTFSNVGSSRARLLLIHAPPFDGYFRELHALASGRAQPDPDALAGLMGKWGMEVVTT